MPLRGQSVRHKPRNIASGRIDIFAIFDHLVIYGHDIGIDPFLFHRTSIVNMALEINILDNYKVTIIQFGTEFGYNSLQLKRRAFGRRHHFS